MVTMWGALFFLMMVLYYAVLLPILIAHEKAKRAPITHIDYPPMAISVPRSVPNRKIQ